MTTNVTTKHCTGQSQVLELVFNSLAPGFVYLIPEWLLGAYILRLVGAAA